MPPKVLPTQQDFEWIKKNLSELGFEPIDKSEFLSDLRVCCLLSSPAHYAGSEEGFSFIANGLRVKVWTTWIEAIGAARKMDAGWVLITEQKTPRYYAREVRRTAHFAQNLFDRARMAWHRVLNRPRCPQCGNQMHITQRIHKDDKPYLRNCRFWRCARVYDHTPEGYVHCEWDYGLPPEVKQGAKRKRKNAARSRKITRAAGGNPQPFYKKRKTLQATPIEAPLA
jgi:hypothetical protein